MPDDFPAWQTVYGYFRRWSPSQVWAQVNQTLRTAVRIEAGGEKHPSLGLMDSQSVAMAQQGALNQELSAIRRSKDANGI